MDKIAVLMATYNGEKYIKEQMDSLLAQTYQDFVCYIHDDGSIDSTVSLIDYYTKLYPSKFFKLDGNSCGGAKLNFFYMMKRMTEYNYKYYMLSDQDDIWLPNKVEESIKRIKEVEKECNSTSVPLLAYCDASVADKDLKVKYDSFEKASGKNGYHNEINYLLAENVVAGCTCIFNRSLLELSTIPVNYKNIYMHDWWLALIASSSGKISFIDKPLMLYRQHGDNSVGTSSRTSLDRKINRAKKTLSLQIFRDARCDIQLRVRQAGELIKLPIIINKKEIVEGFAAFYEKTKLQRMKFMYQNKIYRNCRTWLWIVCA